MENLTNNSQRRNGLVLTVIGSIIVFLEIFVFVFGLLGLLVLPMFIFIPFEGYILVGGYILGLVGVSVSVFLLKVHKTFAVIICIFSLIMFGQYYLNRFSQRIIWGFDRYQSFYYTDAQRAPHLLYTDYPEEGPRSIHMKIGMFQQVKFQVYNPPKFNGSIKVSLNIDKLVLTVQNGARVYRVDRSDKYDPSSIATLKDLGNNSYSVDLAPRKTGHYMISIDYKNPFSLTEVKDFDLIVTDN